MGFFKKLVGSAAVIGAAVGGVSYLKKRKEENILKMIFLKTLMTKRFLILKQILTKMGLRK